MYMYLWVQCTDSIGYAELQNCRLQTHLAIMNPNHAKWYPFPGLHAGVVVNIRYGIRLSGWCFLTGIVVIKMRRLPHASRRRHHGDSLVVSQSSAASFAFQNRHESTSVFFVKESVQYRINARV